MQVGCGSLQNNEFLMLVKMFLEMCFPKDERTVFLKNDFYFIMNLEIY